jgi:mevalonate kinase
MRQVIASSIDREIVTIARKTGEDWIDVEIHNTYHGEKDSARYHLPDPNTPAIFEGSLKYVNAVIFSLYELGKNLQGTSLSIRSNIPMKKGLSSSAALCISVVKALNDLYNLGLSEDDFVRISYRAENGILGIGCGMMDQTAAAHKYPLFMDFQSGFSYQRINLREPLHFVIVDVGGKRDTELILNTLNEFYHERKDPVIVKTLGTYIPEIVRKAKTEMENRCRLEKIGDLMNSNQDLYNEGLKVYCPSELDSPKLYGAIHDVREAGALGAKWIGAGGNGSIIALGKNIEVCKEIEDDIKGRYQSMTTTIG